MILLANPVLLQMVLLLVFAVSVFVLGIWAIRRLRKEMAAGLSAPTPRAENVPAFTVATLQSVIQQLKEKEQALQSQRQEAQERASATENIASAVLRNLETGVVVFNRAGLVQQANPAAQEILGFASMSGLHARDLFRGAHALCAREDTGPASMDEALEGVLRDGAVIRGVQAEYATPSGEARSITITIAPALGDAGQSYGAVCLVSSRS